MERSIDSARTRRIAPGASSGTNGLPSSGLDASREHKPEFRASSNAPGHAANPSIPQRGQASTPARPENRADTMIGGSSIIGASPVIRPAPAPVDPNQPARLKAKPKRFESTFAAQMSQNPQASYRAQAG